MNTTPELSAAEIIEVRSILAERQPFSGPELAMAYRGEREMERKPIEDLKAGYWQIVLGEMETDLSTFTRLLLLLGRSIQQFENDMRAVVMQRRAEAQQLADRVQRDEILARAKPAQEKLDAATTALVGSDWQARLNSGELVQAPYLVDMERGTVTTIFAALREPCAELQQALAGIETCFTYGWKAAPTHLADAREAFDRAVAAHVERQRIPA